MKKSKLRRRNYSHDEEDEEAGGQNDKDGKKKKGSQIHPSQSTPSISSTTSSSSFTSHPLGGNFGKDDRQGVSSSPSVGTNLSGEMDEDRRKGKEYVSSHSLRSLVGEASP